MSKDREPAQPSQEKPSASPREAATGSGGTGPTATRRPFPQPETFIKVITNDEMPKELRERQAEHKIKPRSD